MTLGFGFLLVAVRLARGFDFFVGFAGFRVVFEVRVLRVATFFTGFLGPLVAGLPFPFGGCTLVAVCPIARPQLLSTYNE